MAYVRGEGESVNIAVMRTDGTGERLLTTTTSGDIQNLEPSWSPDGTRLVFRKLNRSETSGYDLWIVYADGSGAQRLLEVPGPQLSPDWSPDGDWIVFDNLSEPLGGMPAGLYLITPAGTGLTRISDLSGSPDWRPRP